MWVNGAHAPFLSNSGLTSKLWQRHAKKTNLDSLHTNVFEFNTVTIQYNAKQPYSLFIYKEIALWLVGHMKRSITSQENASEHF